MAWPAWAITHGHSLFFSGAVNVPHGANLLSNTSGPLVGVVLAPVTWLFDPVTATNVALTGFVPGTSYYYGFSGGTGGIAPNGGIQTEARDITITFPTPRCL